MMEATKPSRHERLENCLYEAETHLEAAIESLQMVPDPLEDLQPLHDSSHVLAALVRERLGYMKRDADLAAGFLRQIAEVEVETMRRSR